MPTIDHFHVIVGSFKMAIANKRDKTKQPRRDPVPSLRGSMSPREEASEPGPVKRTLKLLLKPVWIHVRALDPGFIKTIRLGGGQAAQ